RSHAQRRRQARAEGRRLDPRQRRLPGSRRHGRQREHRPPARRREWRRAGARGRLAETRQGGRRRQARRAHRRHHRGTMITLEIARLPHGEGLPLPAAKTAGAAGLDLAAAVEEPVVLAPGARALVPTGFAIALPAGYEAQVRPRSGLAVAHGVTVLNAPGTIDADYRGE